MKPPITAREVDIVHQVLEFQPGQNLPVLARLHAALLHIVGLEADAERQCGADCLAHRGQRLAKESHTVLERTAVEVIAGVPDRVEHLRV